MAWPPEAFAQIYFLVIQCSVLLLYGFESFTHETLIIMVHSVVLFEQPFNFDDKFLFALAGGSGVLFHTDTRSVKQFNIQSIHKE